MNATSTENQSGRGKLVPTRLCNIRRYSNTGVLYLWFKHKTRWYRESFNTTDEQIAESKRDKRIKEIKAKATQQAKLTDGKISLNDLLTKYLDYNRERVGALTDDGIKPRSFESIEHGVKRIQRDKVEWLDMPAAKMDEDDLCSYVLKLGKDTSPTTQNRVVDTLKNAYALGIKKYWIVRDPTTELKRAGLRLKSDVVISEQQYQDLMAWLRNVHSANKYNVIDLVEFMQFFGTRRNQTANIEKSDVELPKNWRDLSTAVVGRIRLKKEFGKTAKSDRWMPIIRDAAPLIERLLKRGDNFMFGKLRRENKLLPIGKAYGLLNRAYRELGFDEAICGHHHFRHLAATRWRECGLDFGRIGDMLGHSSKDSGKLAMTLYAHVRTEAMDQELSKICREQPVEKVVVGGRAYSSQELEQLVKLAVAVKGQTPDQFLMAPIEV